MILPARSLLRTAARRCAAGGCLFAALAAPLSAQVTVTLTNGQDNTTAYDTTAPADPTTFDVASGTATQSGAVTGSGGIGKTGAGTLTLAGPFSYTGTTRIGEGTFIIGGQGSLTGDIVDDAHLVFYRGDDYTYGGVISGTGDLVNSATILRLTSAQTYTGATYVKGGGYLIMPTTIDQGLTAATTVDLEAGTILDLSNHALTIAGLTGAGTIYSYGGSAGHLTVDTGTGQLQTFSGTLGGSSNADFAFTKAGAGTLALTGTNTYTGGTSVTGGLLEFTSFANLGTDNITLDGGGLRWASGSTTDVSSRLAALGAGGGTFDTDGNDVTLASALTGSGALTKSGAGTLTLSATNTYSGGTTVTAGSLVVTNQNQLGSGDVTVSGGALTVSSSFDSRQNITVSGDGAALNVGDIVQGSNSLILGSGGAKSLTIADGGTVTAAHLYLYASTGATVNLNAGGTLITGYANGLVVNSGTTFNFAGGTLQVAGGDLSTSALLTLSHASTIDTNGFNASLGGALSGTGSLIKSGTGKLTLSGANTYSGGTTISAGTLAITNQNQLGSGDVAVTGGALTTGNVNFDRAVTVTGAGSTLTTTGILTVASAGSATGSLTLATGGSASTTSLYLGLNSGALGTIDVSGAGSRLDVGTTINNGYYGHGTITVADGGVVAAGSHVTLGAVSGGAGTLNLDSGGTFEVGGTDGIAAGAGAATLNLSGGTLKVTGSDFSTSVPATLANTSTIDTNGHNASLSGVLSGAGGLTKAGSGTLALTGANTYSGGTTVSGGTLALTAINQIGSGAVTVNGGTLTTTNISIDRAVTVDGSGATLATTGYAEFGSSGTGSLTVANGGHASTTTTAAVGLLTAAQGTVDLSGTGSRLDIGTTLYTGYLGHGTVSVGSGATLAVGSQVVLGFLTGGDGTLNLDSGGTLAVGGTDGIAGGTGTAHFNLAGGTLQVTGSDLTTSVPATLTNTSTIDTNGYNASLSGVLSGTGGLAKTGSGTLTLTGTNNYTGTTTISAGTLQVGGGGTTGVVAGDIVNEADLVFNRSDDSTYAGAISGSGTVTKSGTGTLTLSGTNTYTGGTIVSAGTLQFGQRTSLYNGSAASWTADNLVVNSGATATFNVGGTGEFAAGDIDTLKTLGSATGGFQSGSFLGFDTTNASGGVFTYDGDIANPNSGANALGIVKTGTGTLLLGGVNTYTGGTIVSAGSLTVTSLSSLGSGHLTLDGGGFRWASGSSLDLSSQSIVLGSGGGTLDTNGNDVALASALSGSGALIETGAGNLTLSATNTYAGGTTVNGGFLTFSTLANLGSGSVTLDGGGLRWASGSTTDVSSRLNALGAGGATFDTNGNDVTLASALSGSGALTKAGTGTLTLTQNNTYSGGTTISAGTLTLGAGGASGSVAGNITNNGTLVFNRSDDYTYAGVISGTGSLIVNGSSILRFFSTQTYTGATSITNGATLVLPTAFDQGLAASTTVDLSSGSSLDLSNRALTIAGLTGSGSVYSYQQSAGHLTLDIGAGQTSTFAGVLGSSYPNFAFTKTGAGTQILTGTNTYTGTTTISQGILQIGDGGSTGTLGMGNLVNNGTLILDRSDSAGRYAGSISGSGDITHSGSGTFTLSGANTYTGATTISAGTLTFDTTGAFYGGTIDATNAARVSVADGATLGLGVGGSSSFSGGDIAVVAAHAHFDAGAGLALDTSNATGGTATLTDFDAGAVDLRKIGAGTLALSGTTSGSGTIEVVTGTLLFGGTAATYGGAVDATNAARISVDAGATLGLAFGGASPFSAADLSTFINHTTFAAGSSLGIDTTGVSGGNLTLSDVNLGSVGLNKLGTGTITLAGTTASTGPTTISGGSLILGSDALLGPAPASATAGQLTLNGGTLATTASFTLDPHRGVAIGSSGGTFDTAAATTLTVAGATSGTGTLTKSGTGTLTLAAGSAASSAITVSAGTLNLGNGGAASLGASGITNNGTLVFNSSSDLTLSGILSGTGGFTKTGSGKLTLANLASTGGITVTAGELVSNESGDDGIDDQAAVVSGNSAKFTRVSTYEVVGFYGTGSLSVTDGGTHALTSTVNRLIIGQYAGSNGTVTVNGTGSTLTSNGRLQLGYYGDGTLNLEAGGTATFNQASPSSVGVAGTGTVNIGSGSTLTANQLKLAVISGSTGTLNLNAGGTLIVSDANGTALSSGNGAATFNFAGGTLKSNGTNSLTVTSNATLAAATTSTFDTNGQAGAWVGILSGSGSLKKAGAGTLTLSAANTYSGQTIVSGGTLALGATGSIARSSSLSIASGATFDVSAVSNFTLASGQTLGGTGRVIGALTIGAGATLAPGNSPGALTTGDTTFAGGGAFQLQLNDASGSAGTNWDQLAVNGTLTLSATSANPFTLDLTSLTTGDVAGAAANFNSASDYSFTFLTTTAGVSGFSSDAFAIDTAHFTNPFTGTWSVSLTGSGRNLSLNYTTASAVPEPSTYAALVGLAALAAGLVTRRRPGRRDKI